jgi:hypothetical protein
MISETGAIDMSNLQNSEVVIRLLTLVSEVANVVDYEVSVDISNQSFSVNNPDGDTVFIAKNSVNQTGGYEFPTAWVCGLFMAVLVICLRTRALGAIYEK